MDISVLATTNDIEQLRALALAMVQKVVSEQAETEKLQQRILLLEEMLKLARQQRFGKKGETLAGMQRSLFEEDMDADIAAVEAQLDMLLPAEEKNAPERPVRIMPDAMGIFTFIKRHLKAENINVPVAVLPDSLK